MKLGARKLHLGCFDRPVQGWLNTDITPHMWIAKIPGSAYFLYRIGKIGKKRYDQHKAGVFRKVHYLNVTKRFPYPNDAFDAIYSCHMLEHLEPCSAEFCLAECFRVLAPGGICRIVVPDLDILISTYHPKRPQEFLTGVYGSAKSGGVKNAHHWLYNVNSLAAVLRKTGFQEIHRCEYRQGRCPDIDILDNRPDESLFIEGIK